MIGFLQIMLRSAKPLPVMTDLTPTEEEDAASKVVRLTDQQWAEICDLYETDKAGITDLAARFDVPLNTMRTWLRRSLQSLRECMSR